MKRCMLVLLTCVLAACGDVDDDQAKVRVVNALYGYDTLDLLVGDQMKIEDLPYGEWSTAIRIGVKDRENEDPDGDSSTTSTVEDSTTTTESTTTSSTSSTSSSTTTTSTTTTTIATGTRTLQVFVDSVATRLIEQAVPLVAQQRYTFYAYEGAAPRLIVEQETKQKFVDGKLKIRVADMAPSSGIVDVYVLEPGQTIAGRTPTDRLLAPTMLTDYFDVDPGSYSIVLAQAGTKTPVLDTGLVDLEAGTLATVVVLDNKGGGLPLGYLLATND